MAALHDPATQIFGLLLCRYHNTAEAFDDFTPLLGRFQQHQDVNLLSRELLHQYATRGRAFYFTGMGGRKKDGRRGQPKYSPTWQAVLGSKAPPLWACVLQSLPQWWDASQRAAALLTDPLTTPHLWYEDFMRIFPRIPLHGYGYWPKFLWGDIGMHLAPKEWNLLQDYTWVGPGPLTQLTEWGWQFPKQPLARQRAGMEAVREVTTTINEWLAAGAPGLGEADLEPLTAYDTQVALCQFKKSMW